MEVVKTSLWTAQRWTHSWYVTRRVWLSDETNTWESDETPSGRIRYFRSREAAQVRANSLNEGEGMKKPDPKPEVRTQIRLPAELHATLAKAAQQNRRSLNAEMLVRLES